MLFVNDVSDESAMKKKEVWREQEINPMVGVGRDEVPAGCAHGKAGGKNRELRADGATDEKGAMR